MNELNEFLMLESIHDAINMHTYLIMGLLIWCILLTAPIVAILYMLISIDRINQLDACNRNIVRIKSKIDKDSLSITDNRIFDLRMDISKLILEYNNLKWWFMPKLK